MDSSAAVASRRALTFDLRLALALALSLAAFLCWVPRLSQPGATLVLQPGATAPVFVPLDATKSCQAYCSPRDTGGLSSPGTATPPSELPNALRPARASLPRPLTGERVPDARTVAPPDPPPVSPAA
jgi:hypothetical protein